MRLLLPTLLVLLGGLQSARAEDLPTSFGKTVDGWIGILRNKASTANDRSRAVRALGYFGPQARAAVPALIEEVGAGGHIADEAVETLVGLGAGIEVTVPHLIGRFLKDNRGVPSGQVVFSEMNDATKQLIEIGGPAVPSLVAILEGPDPSLRVYAADVLCRIGPAAKAAVAALIRAIDHPVVDREAEDSLIPYAVAALGRIGPEARAAVPVLNRLLVQEGVVDRDVVIALDEIGAPPVKRLLDTFLLAADTSAAEDLSLLGPHARDAVPALRMALTDTRLHIRVSAAVALAHIDNSAMEAIPVLIEAMDHRSDGLIHDVDIPKALNQFGPQAKAALPALISLVEKGLHSGDELVTMVRLDPDGEECIPSLILALDSGDYYHGTAAKCLGLLGPKAKDAVPALAAAMTSKFSRDGGNAVEAAKALRRIGPAAKSAIPSLIKALKNRDRRPYYNEPYNTEPYDTGAEAAAQLLGSFGADARDGVPALIDAIRPGEHAKMDWSVRAAAILALGQIGPDAKAAVPIFRDITKQRHPRDSKVQLGSILALYRLAPDGKEIAEAWLAKTQSWVPMGSRDYDPWLEGRAMVLGAMGRTSLETDELTRRYLNGLDWKHEQQGNKLQGLNSWLMIPGRCRG